MIDNFKILKTFYAEHGYNGTEDCFLFGQIIVRKKDGSPFATSNNRVIKDLVFRTPEDFDKKKEEILGLCEYFGARAYVNVNPRSYNTTAIDMAGLCLDYIRNGSTLACRTAFSTVCGRYKAPKSVWVVDVDGDIGLIEKVRSRVPEPLLTVPTVNGAHILTRGFDSRELKTEFDIDIHKNNPTLLYYR